MSGYVDLQINGYAGVDFNQDDLDAESLHAACAALRRDGVDGILATFITDDVPLMRARIARLVALRQQDPLVREIVWGIHVEGPFISAHRGYVGAHPADQARAADLDAMSSLLEAGEGLVRLVTLAPEMDAGQRVTRSLADAGIIVAAGHTDASLDQLLAALDAGLTMFTHLGNGCPGAMARHDNIIQRVLSLADRLWISFIADGAHIPLFVLGNYLKITGIDHAVIVTDAISAAGCGPGRYEIAGQQVDVGADGVPRAADNSHLVGSGTIMSQMGTNLRDVLGLSASDIERLTKENPRRILNSAKAPAIAAQPRR